MCVCGGKWLESNLLSAVHPLSALRLQIHMNTCFVGMDVVEDRTCYMDSNAYTNPCVSPICLSFMGIYLKVKLWPFLFLSRTLLCTRPSFG